MNDKYYLRQVVVLQGKLDGKRPRGKRERSWLKNLQQWYTTTFPSSSDQSGHSNDDNQKEEEETVTFKVYISL